MVGLPAHRGRTIGFYCVALGAAVVLAAGTAQARPSLDGERLDQLDRYEVLSFSDAYKNGIDRGKAIGVIDATSDEVFRVVTDFARYKEFVPRISESSLTARTDDGAQVALTADLPWRARPPAARGSKPTITSSILPATSTAHTSGRCVAAACGSTFGSVYIEPWTNSRGKAQTAITYEFTAEPGIYAPKSLLNKSLRRSAASFVHALRQRINDLHRVGLLHPNAPALASATKPANIIRPAPSTLKAHR